MNTIGERIRYRRKELKLTQTDIKASTGISSGNLSDIENNKAMPSANALISLSRELSVSIDWILLGECNSEYIITDNDETHLLNTFRKLSPMNKGKLLGRVETLLEQQNENSLTNQKLSHSQNSNPEKADTNAHKQLA